MISDLLGTLSSLCLSFLHTSCSKMTEVTFSYGEKKKRIVLSGTESESAVLQELSIAFMLPPNTDIVGLKNLDTGRIYSLSEVISRPETFGKSDALLVIDRIG